MSEKKEADHKFVIAPELEQRLANILKEMREKDPDDERLQGESVFFNFVLSQIAKLIECGYDLDDIEALFRTFGAIEKVRKRRGLE